MRRTTHYAETINGNPKSNFNLKTDDAFDNSKIRNLEKTDKFTGWNIDQKW